MLSTAKTTQQGDKDQGMSMGHW